MITAEQLKDVMERTEALHRYLDIDRKKSKEDSVLEDAKKAK